MLNKSLIFKSYGRHIFGMTISFGIAKVIEWLYANTNFCQLGTVDFETQWFTIGISWNMNSQPILLLHCTKCSWQLETLLMPAATNYICSTYSLFPEQWYTPYSIQRIHEYFKVHLIVCLGGTSNTATHSLSSKYRRKAVLLLHRATFEWYHLILFNGVWLIVRLVAVGPDWFDF